MAIRTVEDILKDAVRAEGITIREPKPILPTIETFTAADLQNMELPEPTWIIPGILTTGFSLLCGKPKVGKSWLSLDIALTCAMGACAMGKIPTEKRKTLVLALEDTWRRLKSRLDLLSGGAKLPPDLILVKSIPRADQGGLQALIDLIKTHKPQLIVIDTFQVFRSANNGKTDAYQADYAASRELKAIADEYDVAFLAVHHLKKQGESDFVTSVSGSSGITGAADTIMVLDKARLVGEATLKITGRDVEEMEYALKKDEQTKGWLLLGDAAEVQRTEEQNYLLSIVKRHPDGITPKEVADITGKKQGTIRQALSRLVNSGMLERNRLGKYVFKEIEPF